MHRFVLLLILSLFFAESCREETDFSHRGRTFLQAGRYDLAKDLYQDMEETAKSHIAREHGLAIATAHIDNIVSLPTEPTAAFYYDLGNYYMGRGQLQKAITAYEQSLIRQPGLTEAAHNLQLALLVKNKQVAPTKPQGQPPANGPNSPAATNTPPQIRQQDEPLEKRLQEVLSRQQILIVVPDIQQQEHGFADLPSW